MIWEIVGRILAITIGGGLSHLSDIPIRAIENNKVRLFARYGVGVMTGLLSLLYMLETFLDAARMATEPDDRRRIMWLVTAAYFLGYVPLGVGVIIAHVLEQVLGGDK